MFDPEQYHAEMTALIAAAVARLDQEHSALEVFTASIWTDPDAATSAVSVDTAEHSAQQVAEADAWAAAHYRRLLAAGDHEQAALFAPTPGARNVNPADFALRDLVTVEHRSFPPNWAEESQGACWDALGPALLRVRDLAVSRFRTLRLHPEAQLAVNSAVDWYDEPVSLAAS